MAHLSSLASKQVADHHRIDFLPLTGDRTKDFETEDFCRQEDAVRVAMLRAAARQAIYPANRDAAQLLARRLDYEARKVEYPHTLACSRFMRDLRISMIGRLCELVEERTPTDWRVTTATISPPDSDVYVTELCTFCPRSFLQAFRAYLYRHGMAEAGGWGCFFIHCDFEPITRMFRFHLHGVVAGEMIAVLDKLRNDPAWAPIKRQVGTTTKIYPRIRVKRQPITEMHNALGYTLKSYWPSKWEGEVDQQAKRQNRHGRIQGSAYARSLLWLDRHTVDDITLLVGLRATRLGLVPSKLAPVRESEGKMC